MRCNFKNRILILYTVFIVLFSYSSIAFAKPRLSVRVFEDRSQEKDAPAGAVMDMMVTELDKAGIFDLIERERFDVITQEMKLAQSGMLDPDTIPEIGKIVSAQYSMLGAIALYYYNEKASGFLLPIIGKAAQKKTAYVVLEIRIVDNYTGRIIYSAEEIGTANREAKGNLATYKGFFIGGYKKTYGGILGSATRDAILKHVAAIKKRNWD